MPGPGPRGCQPRARGSAAGQGRCATAHVRRRARKAAPHPVGGTGARGAGARGADAAAEVTAEPRTRRVPAARALTRLRAAPLSHGCGSFRRSHAAGTRLSCGRPGPCASADAPASRAPGISGAGTRRNHDDGASWWSEPRRWSIAVVTVPAPRTRSTTSTTRPRAGAGHGRELVTGGSWSRAGTGHGRGAG